MAGVEANIKKRLPKWIDWQVVITVVHTTKKLFQSIKLNQATVEKWMMSQAVEDILGLYVSLSSGTVPEVVQKHIQAINLTRGEDDQEVRNVFNTWKMYVWKFLRACVYI